MGSNRVFHAFTNEGYRLTAEGLAHSHSRIYAFLCRRALITSLCNSTTKSSQSQLAKKLYSMATIDLTAPEVDLPKARELLHKALDLLERNDDAAPPSDARTLDVKGCTPSARTGSASSAWRHHTCCAPPRTESKSCKSPKHASVSTSVPSATTHDSTLGQ